MQEYLAHHEGIAFESSFGGFSSYGVDRTEQFYAEDNNKARRKAEENRRELSDRLLGAKIKTEVRKIN